MAWSFAHPEGFVKLLDEFVAVTGYHRKAVIRLPRGREPPVAIALHTTPGKPALNAWAVVA